VKKPTIGHFDGTVAVGYDIHEVMLYVEHRYQLHCYDVFESGKHFDKWCDAKGYGDKDPAGKKRDQSNIWFAEYQDDPHGNEDRPPLVTVLDWLDRKYDIYAHEVKAFQMIDDDFDNAPAHMKEFAKHVKKLFGFDEFFVHSFD
jgi:hypothetical protein